MATAKTLRVAWLETLRRQALTQDDADNAEHEEEHVPILSIFRRCAVFPGRTGLPHSLGSVSGAAVARFLPHGFCGRLRNVALDVSDNLIYSIAVSSTGKTLLAVIESRAELKLAAFALRGSTTARRPACVSQMRRPSEVVFSPDDVAYCLGDRRVVSFTPRLVQRSEFVVGYHMSGGNLCVSDTHVFIVEDEERLVAYARHNGDLCFSFAVPEFACGVCELTCLGQRCVALCYDCSDDGVVIYKLDGTLVHAFQGVNGLALLPRTSSSELLLVDGDGSVTVLDLNCTTSPRRITSSDGDVDMEAFAHSGDTVFMAGDCRVVALN